MKNSKTAMCSISRFELVSAILESEELEDSDMSDFLIDLYMDKILDLQKGDIFISKIRLPSSTANQITKLNKAKIL